MLSNLLDNAIEAQTFVDNKRVEVFIDENEDVCSLKIYNSISDDMVKAFKEDTLFKTHNLIIHCSSSYLPTPFIPDVWRYKY